MEARQTRQRHDRGDDHQQDATEVDVRFGRPASNDERPAVRTDVAQDPGVDYRQWRRDRYKKFTGASGKNQ